MKLRTRSELAKLAAERWKKQYYTRKGWIDISLPSKKGAKTVYEELRALGDYPSPDDVNAAIGNDSWTSIMCDECGKFVDQAVLIGDNNTLCFDCLKAALEL